VFVCDEVNGAENLEGFAKSDLPKTLSNILVNYDGSKNLIISVSELI